MMLLKYIATIWRSLLCCLSMVSMYAFVASLYRFPATSILYGLALSLFIGGCFFAGGFCRFYKKMILLESIAEQQLPIDDIGRLLADGHVERAYLETVERLQEEIKALSALHEAVNQAQLEYYSLWVHQIKTPIAALDLLLQHSQSKEKTAFKMELMKIEDYVDMVLQYARLGSSHTDFSFRKQPLTPIVNDVIKKYATVFIHKKISIQVLPMDKVVLTDEKWLSFILSQIISNALKYTNQGSITIQLVGDVLEITDTGIGIRPEDLPRVFEQGFTGANGRAYQKASGIGLYLCKQIADQIGHPLSISSTLGQGTTVSIDLSYKDVRIE